MNTLPTSGHIPKRRYYVFPTPSDSGPPAAKEESVTEEKTEPTLGSSPPPVPPPHLQRGLTLYAQGDTLAALWAFSQGTDREPDDPLGHYLCGLAFQALGHGQEARAEWETVLALTADDTVTPSGLASGGGAPPSVETQWVRGLVQRLLARGAADDGEKLTGAEIPAPDDVPRVEDGAGPHSQRGLEAAIRDAVQSYGGCYVTDRSLAAMLGVTTEEQVVGWQQSFSAREGLVCHPHRQPIRQDSRHQEGRLQESHSDGVVFRRRESPKAREAAAI